MQICNDMKRRSVFYFYWAQHRSLCKIGWLSLNQALALPPALQDP
jgi:hypothetical protein